MPDISLTRSQNKKNTFIQKISQFEQNHSYTAYAYALIGNVFMVVMQMSLKITCRYISPMHVLSIRGFFLILISSFIVHQNKIDLNVKQSSTFIILIKQLISSALGVVLLFAPLKYIPSATANALFNVGPIIICFVEAIKYKKPMNFKHFVLTVFSFLGILLIIRPDFLFGESNSDFEEYKYFMLFSLGAAFANSFTFSYIHDLKGKVSSVVTLHYFYIGQCLFNNLFMMFQEQNKSLLDINLKFYLGIAGFTIFSYLYQNLMNRALILKKPSYIMPFGYVTIILSSIVDNLIFGSQFGALSIIGMFLTSSGLFVKLLIPQNDEFKKSIENQANNNHNKKIPDQDESFSIEI